MAIVSKIQCEQFIQYIIRPTLLRMGQYKSWLVSEAAENLLLWTALVESELKYIHQFNFGPAIGFWEMEPSTHDDVWRWLQRHQELIEYIDYVRPEADEMHGNAYYACAMARCRYAMVPKPLPNAKDIPAMAEYWGRFYNTKNLEADKTRFINLASQTLS